jgi:hypothetical protein
MVPSSSRKYRFKGAECGRVREYSDTLLIFLLKATKPEKYRERHEHEHRHDHKGKVAADVNLVDERRRNFFRQLGETLAPHPEAKLAVRRLLQGLLAQAEQPEGAGGGDGQA